MQHADGCVSLAPQRGALCLHEQLGLVIACTVWAVDLQACTACQPGRDLASGVTLLAAPPAPRKLQRRQPQPETQKKHCSSSCTCQNKQVHLEQPLGAGMDWRSGSPVRQPSPMRHGSPLRQVSPVRSGSGHLRAAQVMLPPRTRPLNLHSAAAYWVCLAVINGLRAW